MAASGADSNPVRRDVAALAGETPTMPVPEPDTVRRGYPHLIVPVGLRFTLGWQDTRKDGPCFVVAQAMNTTTYKVLDRFPLTEKGWGKAWADLANRDASAAQAVADKLQQPAREAAAHKAEAELQAQVFDVFASAGQRTVFRNLHVQVLNELGRVYTSGFENAATRTSTARPLGPLAGAEATVTDGSQAWSPGRAMLMPIALAPLATKTQADAVVVFRDGTVHTAALDGNYAVRLAQREAAEFNALAMAADNLARQSAGSDGDPANRLRKLDELRTAGLLTEEEYAAKRAEIIDTL